MYDQSKNGPFVFRYDRFRSYLAEFDCFRPYLAEYDHFRSYLTLILSLFSCSKTNQEIEGNFFYRFDMEGTSNVLNK